MSFENLFASSSLKVVVPDTSVPYPPQIEPDEWLEALDRDSVDRKQAFFGELWADIYFRIAHRWIIRRAASLLPDRAHRTSHIRLPCRTRKTARNSPFPAGSHPNRIGGDVHLIPPDPCARNSANFTSLCTSPYIVSPQVERSEERRVGKECA